MCTLTYFINIVVMRKVLRQWNYLIEIVLTALFNLFNSFVGIYIIKIKVSFLSGKRGIYKMEIRDIDVIIPVHNVSKTLKKCITSLQQQNFTSYNLILIDDGSTDGSSSICDQYKKIKNIYVYHIKNRGVAYARNYGLKVSKSKYIMFVDSDDWVTNDFLKEAFEFMEMTNSDIGIFGYYKVSANHRVIPANKSYLEKTKGKISKENAIKGLLTDTIGNFSWNKIYKKETFNGIRFPVGRTFEDIATMYKIINNARSVGVLDKFLYYYYQRDNSIMHSLSRKTVGDALYARLELEKYIKKNYPALIDLSHRNVIANALQYMIYFYREQISLKEDRIVQAEQVSKILDSSGKIDSLHWKDRLKLFLFRHNKSLFKFMAIKTGKKH